MDKIEKLKKQREWALEEISKRTSGKPITQKQRSKIFKQVWKEAKRRFK